MAFLHFFPSKEMGHRKQNYRASTRGALKLISIMFPFARVRVLPLNLNLCKCLTSETSKSPLSVLGKERSQQDCLSSTLLLS